jgi:membrane-bound ClpP family serine protease
MSSPDRRVPGTIEMKEVIHLLKLNMGRLDRTLRFVAGVALMLIGLFALNGWQGSLIGIVVAALALIPLLTSLTGFCPAYIPFGISTRSESRKDQTGEAQA